MHLDSHSPALKLSHVTLEQFHITMDVLEHCTRVIGKPRFAYLAEAKDLIIRWPSAIHEAPINTVDSIFLQEVVMLNYPLNLVSMTLGHNTELKTMGGSRAVPDICVEFYSKGPIPKVTYPVICQISFTESSNDAFDVIESIVEANPSIQMAMLLDVKESLDFSQPSSQSETWKSLSQDLTPLSLQEFITASNLMGRATTFAELITVSHHVWCSIVSVNYYVWLRDSTGALDIRATSEHTAHGSMPGNTRMDAVQNMIVQGLDLIRKSLIVFCEDMMQVSMVMADLVPLENHISCFLTTFDSFADDLKRGASLTAHSHYITWFDNSFQGTKHSHDDEEYAMPAGSEDSPADNCSAGDSIDHPHSDHNEGRHVSRRLVKCGAGV
ncbi:hypothetical protein PISMIDRAFT_13450 [Pisolithus microcarpus 441]|uniref:Uncharacterized protein n=1 Tax=Pisolithus microcarpus 441 TaxID=765257 RepID=A0A0C9YSV3_9AGAM|nr:hypothetical protein PISMIDRAFT_13450 [Pisolithus microcarpus 441]